MRPFILAIAALLLLCGPAAAVTIPDSRGDQTFEQPPERAVALSWSLAEQLVELGVPPVGMADPEGYRVWVRRPALPDGVLDVGLRQEPNYERIAELNPDVILLSDDQRGFIDQLQRIAPVVHFDTFSEDHDNAAAAVETFRTLGRLFGREDVADARLAERDQRLAALRETVQAHFDGDPPPVTVVRLSDEARARVYDENSMPVAALNVLGLETGYPLPPTRWGVTAKTLRDLAAVSDGPLLYIEPFEHAEELFANPLWKAMPFVRGDRVRALPPTWTYGGAFSILYLAEAIADALLELPRT